MCRWNDNRGADAANGVGNDEISREMGIVANRAPQHRRSGHHPNPTRGRRVESDAPGHPCMQLAGDVGVEDAGMRSSVAFAAGRACGSASDEREESRRTSHAPLKHRWDCSDCRSRTDVRRRVTPKTVQVVAWLGTSWTAARPRRKYFIGEGKDEGDEREQGRDPDQ